MSDIGIVDIAMGNLRSVANAVSSVGYDPVLVRRPADLAEVSHLILPGVGSFRVAMEHLAAQDLIEAIRAFAASGRPLLGICLGMQLLGSSGDEGGGARGLDLVQGRVVRLDPGTVPAIPHVGWNEVRTTRVHPVLRNVKTGRDFYFVHSYHFVAATRDDVLGTVDYGGHELVSIVARDSVVGFQFHPEKSQANGVRLIENFCDWDGTC